MQIELDDGFRRLLFPLSDEERVQLESNLVSDGCRDPLVVWRPGSWLPDGEEDVLFWDHPDTIDRNDIGEYRIWVSGENEFFDEDWPRILIDGHNRYEICERLGVAYQVVEMEFASRDDAEDWIDRNQAGRRNATPEQLSLIRGRRYNRAKRKQGGTGANQYEQTGQNVQSAMTAEVLADQHGVDEKTIRRDGKFAEAVEALGIESEVIGGEVDAPKAAIIDAAKPIVEASRAHARWEEEVKERPLAPPPEPPLPTAEDIQRAKAHVSHNSGENEWYTPVGIIDSARRVMGKIDCDPASSELANKTVGASVFYTKEQDGLSHVWEGMVWLNPPYAQPLIAQFAEAVSSKYESGEIDSAIVLVNNATETAWFQRMASVATAICLPRGRIRFLDVNGNPGAPLQGQAILYFGVIPDAFVVEFASYGSVFDVARI